jgi:hypothetical protein
MSEQVLPLVSTELMCADVDTILIRSEKEDQKANRVYNYRVPSSLPHSI